MLFFQLVFAVCFIVSNAKEDIQEHVNKRQSELLDTFQKQICNQQKCLKDLQIEICFLKEEIKRIK